MGVGRALDDPPPPVQGPSPVSEMGAFVMQPQTIRPHRCRRVPRYGWLHAKEACDLKSLLDRAGLNVTSRVGGREPMTAQPRRPPATANGVDSRFVCKALNLDSSRASQTC